MLGLDYAGSSPGAAAVKAAGYGFVARYLSRYTAKTINQAEFQDMTGNGVDVVLVFEDYANQALSGYNQGVADAQVALAQARAIGWPEDRPIHFAVDFDISDAQKPAAGQYMKGAASVLGLARTGAYGGYWWIKYCDDNNLATPNARWQATAWSGGMIHATATLFQQLGGTTVNGTSCDINKSLKDDFGQWPGENMNTFTPDQANLLWSAAFNRHIADDELPWATTKDATFVLQTVFNNNLDFRTKAANFDNFARALDDANNKLKAEDQTLSDDKQTIADLQAKIAELQKPAPVPDPTPTPEPQPTPDPTPTRLPGWLQAVINFLQGK